MTWGVSNWRGGREEGTSDRPGLVFTYSLEVYGCVICTCFDLFVACDGAKCILSVHCFVSLPEPPQH